MESGRLQNRPQLANTPNSLPNALEFQGGRPRCPAYCFELVAPLSPPRRLMSHTILSNFSSLATCTRYASAPVSTGRGYSPSAMMTVLLAAFDLSRCKGMSIFWPGANTSASASLLNLATWLQACMSRLSLMNVSCDRMVYGKLGSGSRMWACTPKALNATNNIAACVLII